MKLTERGRTVLMHVFVSFAAFGITVSHRPDSMLNPQFWAEDGKMWFAQAYNNGIVYSLFTTEAGYFQTISRLVAAIAQFVPFAYAPFVFNFAAISIKVLVANFILSSRLANAVPNIWGRGFLAFIYLALPHSFETTANLTNAQWHLALLAFLILISSSSEKPAWKIFDVVMVALSALSGPFCILLLPIAVITYLKTRDNRIAPLALILLGAAFVQLTCIFLIGRPAYAPLGAEIGLFFRIVGGHLFFDAIFGDRNYGRMISYGWWNDILAAIVVPAGLTASAYAFVRAKFELRMLLVFAAMVVTAALISPVISRDVPQWVAMWPETGGSRYWMIPIFAFLASIFSIAVDRENKLPRRAAVLVLLLSSIGVITDWSHPKFADLDFQGHALRFEAASAGESVIIPINPNWEMTLVKK